MKRSTRRHAASTALLLMAGLSVPTAGVVTAAAGDDTTPTTEPASPADSAPPTTTEPLVIDGDPACTPYVGVTQAFSSEAPDPEAITALLDELDAAVPDDVADEVPVMTEAARAVLASEGQDFSPFETPEFAEAQATVDTWMFENCEFDQKVEVTTIDTAFEGMPDELEGGVTAFLVTNEGDQMHELLMLRRLDGVTETWAELLEMPEEEAMAKTTVAGAGFVPMTGSVTLVVADLEAGDHLAICFVPGGSMMHEDGEMTEGTGPPHFVDGMIREFSVVD